MDRPSRPIPVLAPLRAALAARPLLVDAATAAVLAGTAILLVLVTYRITPDASRFPPQPLSLGATALLCFPLALRRRLPLAVLSVTTVSFIAYRHLQVPETSLSAVALFLALYTVGAHVEKPRADVARLASIGLLLAYLLYALVDAGSELGEAAAFASAVLILYNVFFFGLAWFLGDAASIRRANEIELEVRARELERERDERAARAVLDERLRIARELHDVVGHHVSVIGIQAAAARMALERRPVEAAEALAAIESTSREGVAEMGRMLAMLRETEEPVAAQGRHEPEGAPRGRDERGDDREAPASLRHLPALLAEVRRAGLSAELHIEGERPPELPGLLELTAYRIVQEALTNTLKHARARRAEVHVRYRADRVELVVADDGRGAVPPTRAPGHGGRRERAEHGDASGGHGLIGMRERVALYGGTFSAGPSRSGGFLVRASLPYTTTGERPGGEPGLATSGG